MFQSRSDRFRPPHGAPEALSHDKRAELIREALPVWARFAAVTAGEAGVAVTLDDECSAGYAKTAELRDLLVAVAPGPIEIQRSLRYTHIYRLVESVVGPNPDLRIKLDRQAPLVYVILPSSQYPRSEDLRARIETAAGIRTCLVLSDPSHRPIVLLPPPSDDAVQAAIEKTHLRLLRKQVGSVIPESWRAAVDVTPRGVDITYLGILRSCQEEDRIRAKIEQLTDLPVTIARPTRQDNLRDALYTTVPEGIEVWKSSFYKVNLKGRDFHCAFVQVHVPPGRDAESLAWRLSLEERFGVQLILQPERVSLPVTRQLRDFADSRGLIATAEPVRYFKAHLNGRAPEPEPISPGAVPLGKVMDLRSFGFLTFDSIGTKEPEDALFAESRADGSIRLLVSFADASRAVRPESKLGRHARKAAFSLYCGDTVVPMLGEELTFRDLSLLPGQERLAWTVDMVINPRGKIVQYDFYRALIKVAAGYTHADLDALDTTHALRGNPMFESLQRAARLIEQRGSRYRGFLDAEPEAPSDRIVGACMVTARERIAHFFASRSIPVPFRIHGPPGSRQRTRFIRTARALGISARADDFNDPQRLTELLKRIEEHPGGRALFHEILDAHLQRAHFSRHRAPHIGAKCEQYTEIKALRSYAGLLTQWQADHYFAHGTALVSHERMEREVRHLNRKSRTAWQNTQRLVMLQRIEDRLAAPREPVEAIVEEDKRGGTVLYVPALAAIGMPVGFDRADLQPGARLAVSLAGYHVRSMRYAFGPAKGAGHALGGSAHIVAALRLEGLAEETPAKVS